MKSLTPTEVEDIQFIKTQAKILCDRLVRDEGAGARPERMRRSIVSLEKCVRWALYAINDESEWFAFKKEESMISGKGRFPSQDVDEAAEETSELVSSTIIVDPEDQEIKVYMGVKMIRAYREQKADPAGPLDGYHVIDPDGYESWSPKAQFESAHLSLENSTKITDHDVHNFLGRLGIANLTYNKLMWSMAHGVLSFVRLWAKNGLINN